MTAIRRLFALSAACAAVWPGSTTAQPAPAGAPAPAMTYEYAVAPQPGAVVYRAEPVVQPLPGTPATTAPPVPPAPPALPAPPAAMPAPRPAPSPAPVQAGARGPDWHDVRGPSDDYGNRFAAPVAPYGGMPPAQGFPPPGFDRQSWLADCRTRIRGVDREDDRASIIGGLLGAVAGGVVGNRLYDSHRTAGTLIGAGAGSLAGLAIGATLDAAGKRRNRDECAAYLDRYIGVGYPGHDAPGYGGADYAFGDGYPLPRYGYGCGCYGYGVTYMPVLVAVPQRQVVRETVTEEWVDVPARTVTRSRAIHERAPAPLRDKRVKIIKR